MGAGNAGVRAGTYRSTRRPGKPCFVPFRHGAVLPDGKRAVTARVAVLPSFNRGADAEPQKEEP